MGVYKYLVHDGSSSFHRADRNLIEIVVASSIIAT